MERDASDQYGTGETAEPDDARGDDVYQPVPSEDDEAASRGPDPENTLVTDPLDDTSVPGYSPPERPRGVTRYGTTQREQRAGEPLDARLAQEIPDAAVPGGDGVGDVADGAGEPVDEEAGAVRAGRLAPVDVPPGGRRDRAVARDVGVDEGAASAEEAAMHVDTAVDGAADESTAAPGEPA
ncbi:DUF5709 domain-containing protein [Streptomyces sp. NPDC048018]|uniref:DUF5709 domain-containing protein n=1 Tax=Streptomyces sp. NPDC048018 TaxID=3365499 RepID=UPI0037171BFB